MPAYRAVKHSARNARSKKDSRHGMADLYVEMADFAGHDVLCQSQISRCWGPSPPRIS